MQLTPGAFSLVTKRRSHGTDHSPSTNAEHSWSYMCLYAKVEENEEKEE
jgi:hypothetical protein